jgi:polysaccharide export outer membrane protein
MSNTKLFLTACAFLLVMSASSTFGQNSATTESASPNMQVQVRPDTASALSSSVSPEMSLASIAPGAPPRAPLPPGAGQADSDRPVLQQRNPRYKVEPDDTLSISFPLSPEFDQPILLVQPDGYINLPGATSICVKGLTVPEIVESLKKAYSGTLHDPIISVDLVDFQRPFFLVSGQVGKPGQYDLRHETTVSEAVATAGGFAPTAKTQVFLFHRVSTGWVEVKKLNIKDILNGKNVNEDAYLSTGDMIFVPEKTITKFRKYVPYNLGTGIYPTTPAF